MMVKNGGNTIVLVRIQRNSRITPILLKLGKLYVKEELRDNVVEIVIVFNRNGIVCLIT